MKRHIMPYLLLLGILLLSGCGGLFSVHRLDIQQGNAIDETRLAQLQPGMSPAQVRYLLGEPVLRHPFRGQDRWDYVYYFKPGDGSPQSRHVIIYFEHDQVTNITHAAP